MKLFHLLTLAVVTAAAASPEQEAQMSAKGRVAVEQYFQTHKGTWLDLKWEAPRFEYLTSRNGEHFVAVAFPERSGPGAGFAFFEAPDATGTFAAGYTRDFSGIPNCWKQVRKRAAVISCT
jgi:hypothetical protein